MLGFFRRVLKGLGYPKEVVRKLKGVEDCVEKKCKHKRDKLKTPAPSKKSIWGARRLLQQTQDQPLVELANTAILANPTGVGELLESHDTAAEMGLVADAGRQTEQLDDTSVEE